MILIVDDMIQVAEMLKATIEPLGYDVVTVYTGEQAIEAAMITPPDLVILDYNLGWSEITGEEVCVILHQANPKLPIIILSGIAGPQEISDMLRACAKTFVRKPYSPMYILQLVETLLKDD